MTKRSSLMEYFVLQRFFALIFLCGSSLSFASSPDAVDSAWLLATRNKMPQALELITKQTLLASPEQQVRTLVAKAAFESASGQADSALQSVWQVYLIKPDPDFLMLALDKIMGGLRRQDSVTLARGWEILHFLEKEHPTHSLRWEMQAELVPSLVSKMSADSIRMQMDRLGLIRDWRMLGPFENVSNCAFLHPLAPEAGTSWGKPFIGKDQLEIVATAFHDASLDGWVRIDQVQGVPRAVNYFASAISSEKARAAILSFGVSGSYTVWLNGERLLDEPTFRNVGVQGFRVKIRLRKGANNLVVKVGHEKTTFSNFIVCMQDSTGLPLRLVASDRLPALPVLGPVTAQTNQILPSSWVETLAQQPEGFSRDVLLADYWIQNDGFENARPFLDKLMAQYPQSAWAQALAGELYSREEKLSLADQHFQQALHLDSTLAIAWNYEFSRRVSRQDWNFAITWFEKRPSNMELSSEQIFSAIKAYLSLSRDNDAWAWVDTLVVQRKQDPDAWIFASGVHAAIGDRKLAVSILEQAGPKVLVMSGVMNELLDRYKSQGDLGKAMELLHSRLIIEPQSRMDWQLLAEFAIQTKDYTAALTACENGLLLSPNSSKLLLFQARALEMRAQPGDVQRAAQAYRKALDNPEVDSDIGTRYQELTAQPELKDLRRKWSLDSLVQEGKSWKEGQGHHSVILLAQRSVRWQEWGGVEQYVRLVVEVRTSKGVDQWKEQDAAAEFWSGNPEVLRAVTHKADGRVIEADVYGSKVVFQGLEPGDRLELEAVSFEHRDGPLAGNFWALNYMGASSPVLHNWFEVFSPKTKDAKFQYDIHQQGLALKPEVTQVGPVVRKVWHTERTKGFEAEMGMPAWGDVLPMIVVSSVKKWESISSWYEQLSEGKTASSPELLAVADSLFAGVKTEAAKVEKVQEWIEHNVRYSHQLFRQSGFVPQDATKTLLTRIGDCKDMATLGKALLKLGGVKSQLVLVNTNDQELKATLPMDLFNHCILWVNVEGGRYVDFTADQNGWRDLPRSDQQSMVLRVNPQGIDSITNIPFDAEGDSLVRESWDTLQTNGDLQRRMLTIRGGNFAAEFRYNYGQERPERVKELSLRALQATFPGVELQTMDVGPLDLLQNDLRYETKYHIRRYANAAIHSLVLRIPWSDPLNPGDLPGEDFRNYPWVAWKSFAFWGIQRQNSHIVLPEGYHATVIPQAVKVQGRYGSYETSYSLSGRILEATRSWKPSQFEVAPKDYPALRRELEAIIQADRQSLVLVNNSNQ